MTQPWVANQGNNFQYIHRSRGNVNQQGVIAPDPLPDPALLNPYVSSEEWGEIILGGVLIECIVQDVDGAEKPEEWAVQKGTATNHATTVWRGTKIAESIKITFAAHDVGSFNALYIIRETVRPKLGEKPPSLLITNPAINFNGILLVTLKNLGQPKWNAQKGYWTIVLELIEYNPSKKANAGPANPAKPGNKEPQAQDAADREIQDLMKEVKNL